ncbi:MAG: Acetate CoA-transferase YdiF [Candidatus Hydrogenedentes bacterium ADurb.Bin101]|jgi:propionate CoA-transferase|nr:MAG: Acetate CoA-transferase YdiF [Candidatus Hydrogenedentes bacterium ADurb.Bin101]HOC67217.1 CoA-transferase [Candidatus Hydrogenedentota bacterium]
MNFLTKMRIMAQVYHWRLTWNRKDLHYPPPVKDNPKFMTAWDAVKLIPDGSVIANSGMGGNQRTALLFWAIRDSFLKEGRPKNLTVLTVGGQGGRGKAPGTLEELAYEGLNTRLFTAHTETFKGQLHLAEEGKIEIQCGLIGIMTFMFREQIEGRDYFITETGIGTFIDPRVGNGSPIAPPNAPQYVEVTPDGKLKFTMPLLDTAMFNAPAADRKGNIYFKGSSVIGDAKNIAKAAKKNNGRTLVNVGRIVEEGYDDDYLSAEYVDAVVYWPGTEQSGTIKHRKYWDCFTPHSTMPVDEGLARVRLINKTLGIMPIRRPIDDVMARLATKLFADHANKGDYVDIGIGLPEEVARLLHESGVMKKLNMLTEAGAVGGVAAPGVFFGAAINPDKVIPSSDVFDMMYKRLDWVVLGMLQADSQGNVNVSKRGKGPKNHVGPGGFIDLVTCAKSILFCGAWGARSKVEVRGDKVKVIAPGIPKFVDKVDEITFNGQEALKHGKNVYYVSQVGAFKLTSRGMELIYVMPGVDIQKDILDVCPMKIVMPESGAPQVVGPEVVTGKEFRFELHG